MNTQRLTVAQALVKFLAAQFTERDGREERLIAGVWAIFGHGNVSGLGQALEEYGKEVGLPTYRPQNEQAMVHAAIAYAKHKNRLSTFACTASVGPGSTNMLTAAATATVNRLPVLLLPSDYFANRLPDPVLQQLEHPTEHDVSVNDAFRPLSRFFTRITRPSQLLSALPEAMRVLTDPAETGAVTLALPEDVQTEAYDWPETFFARRVWRVRRPVPEPEALAEAVRLIKEARRPLIVSGGGTLYSEAWGALAAFAEALGIPVCETQGGKGALPWNHPMNVGPIGANGGSAANRLAREADLVLAVGTRLGDFATASKTAFQHPGVRLIGLNVAPFDAAKLGGVMLVADARRGLEALREALKGHEGTSAAYRAEVERLKREWDQTVTAYRTPRPEKKEMAQAEVIGLVNEVYGGKATVICAAGSLPGDLLKLWRPEDPKAYHLEYGFSCMGYEIAAGLGVKLAEPGREVVVFVGDGSYLMMNSEIVTAVAEGLSFTIVLVDNRAFGSIRGLQMSLGSPSFNNELRARNPQTGRTDGPPVVVDFAAHARAMGASVWHPKSYGELEQALKEAREARGVRVVVVPVSLDDRVPGFEGWWDVPVAEVSSQPAVREARRAYEAALKRQRRYF
ncbi:MAG: 3D-(3,5/4)-trihydroxycyclohexane-1,2-dione acylhydrolase (decyclizing) [Meiothermus sp.]|uniref:3D-(3,5/4)-trihydroxycyclohexane-1,2-dione acylhydrolase (decyclizing) n=3 Tax=Meiothermus sp. TaxID=1955249 RepID=UPI0025E88BD9|nr:3D-(3,5/4)-trihydroxycyclohexane-1,2-dione acylhydrolase (decyclizing) [Meiothermus sp.]MCS7193928.1 3D-(3,5/4)-trihydroxycyclohexane-1,2-dione acylhydrolase (decyclizing) [Meiothermus sp.]MDW8091954.1 3D-(3,5/4)-trihydroxycyclohexane-1,2-dione acylhydrolase (decyclizing) [Meiothermus sp.]MDW8480397.1 3D-(3,5/4)-trihydroxycyclohexane-1,2-dione acylhydrolase (decyclizing) [Meiothermus sp.]